MARELGRALVPLLLGPRLVRGLVRWWCGDKNRVRDEGIRVVTV